MNDHAERAVSLDLSSSVSEEFWRIARVAAATGLSKSEVYRLIRQGDFPKSRPYPHSVQSRFWLRSDILAWQQRQLEPGRGMP